PPLSSSLSNTPPTTALYPLSLHDALPILSVLARHADVGEHDVGRRAVEALNGLIAIADGDDLDVLVSKRQLDDALNRHAVVGKRSEEHTSELQSLAYLVCRLLLEKKKHKN